MHKLYILFGFIMIITSCIRREEIDIAGMFEKKPVVFAMITPNADSTKVWVSRTFAYGDKINHIVIEQGSGFGYSYPEIEEKDALVFLEGNDTLVQLIYDKNQRQYCIGSDAFAVNKGSLYKLTVKLNSGETATSETIVPDEDCRLDSVASSIIKQSSDEEIIQILVEFFWKNKIKSSSIYLIDNYHFIGNYQGIKRRYGNLNKDIGLFNNFCFSSSIIEIQQGTNDTVPAYLYIANAGFSETLNLFEFMSYNNDNDFFLEAFKGVYPEYTNISNGYGYFGSYLKSAPYLITTNLINHE